MVTKPVFRPVQPLRTRSNEFTEGIYAHIIERNSCVSISEGAHKVGEAQNEVWLNKSEAKALYKWLKGALGERDESTGAVNEKQATGDIT